MWSANPEVIKLEHAFIDLLLCLVGQMSFLNHFHNLVRPLFCFCTQLGGNPQRSA